MADKSPTPQSSWTKEDSCTYRQPYGFQEVLYNAIMVPPGSPGLFLIATWVTFKHTPSSTSDRVSSYDLVPQLREAWLQMRHKYPGLAAENLSDGKSYKSPLTDVELKHWLDTTFVVIPSRTSTEHWRNMVKPKQMTLNYLPEEQQLFLQGEHHILDGRGLMNFWDRFFGVLASPGGSPRMQIDGSEVSRLPLRSDDLLNMTERSPGRGEMRAQEILAPLTAIDAPICIPVSQPLLPCSQRNSAEQLKASSSLTKGIISACKAQRLSVTASWHAAVVLAAQTVQRERNSGAADGSGTKLATFGNFDLRRYFPASDKSDPSQDSYSIGNHHCVLPCVVEPDGKTFAQIADELARFYQQDLPKGDPEVWSALGPMVQTLVPEFTQAQLQETTPAVSSLGAVDSFIKSTYTGSGGKGTWHVKDVWFGDTVTGPWLECFLWTWQGRLSLNTCYNSAYYNYTEVDDFNQLVLEKMMEGLGLGSREHASRL